MKSVTAHLQGTDFPRIRIGIGHVGSDGWKDFVLDEVSRDDAALLADAVDRAADSVCSILEDGIDIAMNRWNKKNQDKEE